MAKKEEEQMSQSVVRRKAAQKKLSDVQRDLCVYLNSCFLESETNPITMALELTKRFNIERRKKQKKELA